jgi:hypothetical protein
MFSFWKKKKYVAKFYLTKYIDLKDEKINLNLQFNFHQEKLMTF